MADHPSPVFTGIFLVFFVTGLAVRIWLALRQIRHVTAHRHAVPARFSGAIPLPAHQKAADYTIARTRLALSSLGAEHALLLALTLGGGIAALHAFWAARADGIVQGLLLIGSVAVLSALVDLPFALWRTFVLERRFGFNRTTPALFAADLARGALLALVLGAPLVAAVLWLLQTMGEGWWLWAWLFWCAFNLALLFVYPTWIAPLFNRFTPLPDGELKSRVEALLARCGFRSGGLFVMDGSRRSAHGNAYFTGLGRQKRIVFFDTLLERLRPEEVEAVLAHELGHFHHRHVTQRIVLMLAAALGFLALLGQLIDAPWFLAGLGVPVAAGNPAPGLLAFFLALPVFTLFATPLGSLISRRQEYEADHYAARHAGADHLIGALVRLYADNAATLTPDPLHSLFHDTHPPAALRVARLAEAA